MEKTTAESYEYKNYIPFKDYLDMDGFGASAISEFIMRLPHTGEQKRGLVHLLNMLRLSSIEDEITIVTNLFRDDPSFAYFITNRLFLFSMIPVMDDRALQNIFNRIDDVLIAKSLRGETAVLVKKVLANVSKRRARYIEETARCPGHKDNEPEKEEMNRVIRSYFEEKFGRVLKIPESVKTRYTILRTGRDIEEACTRNPHHEGDIIAVSGKTVYLFRNRARESLCSCYDTEMYKDALFCVCGVSESAVFLRSNEALSFVLIHIYDWRTDIESCEFAEQVSRETVLPVRRVSSKIVLTIGAIDSRGRPREQVLRLSLH